ncbi:MAG: tetratricopeptide repeat protein, partial [Nitrospinota bacterium]|nr:tetratricopeptide repeat protein [Nitrospinota bacterium]
MARGAGKIDRRALRRPDEFITRSAKVIKYVQVNKKKVLLIVGGVLVVFVAVFAYRMYQGGQEARASSLVSMAIEGFGKYPTNSAPFERIIHGYSGTRGARLAGLYLAHSLHRKGEAERAAKAYQKLTEDSAAPELLRTEAILGRGYAFVTLKRCKEAESAFKQTPAKAGLAQQQAQLAIGQCYELKGEPHEALKHFQEFAGRFPQSPL